MSWHDCIKLKMWNRWYNASAYLMKIFTILVKKNVEKSAIMRFCWQFCSQQRIHVAKPMHLFFKPIYLTIWCIVPLKKKTNCSIIFEVWWPFFNDNDPVNFITEIIIGFEWTLFFREQYNYIDSIWFNLNFLLFVTQSVSSNGFVQITFFSNSIHSEKMTVKNNIVNVVSLVRKLLYLIKLVVMTSSHMSWWE